MAEMRLLVSRNSLPLSLGASSAVAVTPEPAGSFCEADTPAGAAVFAFSIISR